MPCVLPIKASTRGPVCCCCYSVVKDRFRLFNQRKAPRVKPAESGKSNRLNFFCQPVFALFYPSFGDRLREQAACCLIVRTAANYLIGMDQSRGKVTEKYNFLILKRLSICAVFYLLVISPDLKDGEITIPRLSRMQEYRWSFWPVRCSRCWTSIS